VVVTGANCGVGPELVKKLMEMEMDVIAGLDVVPSFIFIFS